MAFGIDCATPVTGRVADLKKARVTFVCRYVSTVGNPKNITHAEVVALRQANINRVIVFETVGDRVLSGKAAGVEDATSAIAQLHSVSLRPDTPVYFAVDFDAQPSQFKVIGEYFTGVASVLSLHRTGCYGGIHIITYLFDNKLIHFGWQTYAWSGGKWDTRAHLQQYQNGEVVAGISCDYDRNIAVDYGQERKVVKKLVGYKVTYHTKKGLKRTDINKVHRLPKVRYIRVRRHGTFTSVPIHKEVIGV